MKLSHGIGQLEFNGLVVDQPIRVAVEFEKRVESSHDLLEGKVESRVRVALALGLDEETCVAP